MNLTMRVLAKALAQTTINALIVVKIVQPKSMGPLSSSDSMVDDSVELCDGGVLDIAPLKTWDVLRRDNKKEKDFE